MSRTKEELSKLTVVDLRNALKELGQPFTGKKEELVERLFAAEEATAGGSADAAAEPAPEAAAAPEPAQPEEALPAGAPAADPPAEEPAAEAPKDDGKRARIVFSDEAVKAMPAQITVIHSVELAKPVKPDTEKLKERADRFKDPEIEKAKQRALRFGVFNADIEKEKAKKRAERFGTPNEDLDEERKAKRAARFGIVDPVAKLASRAERFGIAATAGKAGNAIQAPKSLATGAATTASSAEFEAQKKARAARFGTAV